MAATAASSSKTTKKVGKENAPPRSTKDPDFDMDDDFDAFPGDEVPKSKSAKPSSTSTAKPLKSSKAQEEDIGSGNGKDLRSLAALERTLTALTAERDRLRSQRDTFSKQFEELSKTRSTATESLFEKYKEKAAIQAKAQNDIISNQTILTEKLQSRVRDLEKALKEATSLPAAGGPFDDPPAKADPKEVKLLKDELAKIKMASSEKNEKISSLEKEYKAEVEHSRSLQNSRSTVPAVAPAVSVTSEESIKDAACLRLYEDFTELNIANVRIKDVGKGGKEITFNCVQTYAGRSINFKLKAFNQLDQELVRQKAENPWVKSIRYNPEGLEFEKDQEFVGRLGVFASEFTAPRDQLSGLFEDLKSKLAGEDGDE